MGIEEVQATQTNPAAEAVSTEAPEATQQSASTTDIDGLSEFTFQGEKYTPEQLHKILTEARTYGEQAKSYQEEKKYLDNLDADLENVLQDPRLADRFKQVYPNKFHGVLDKLLRDQRQGDARPNAQSSLPKEFLNEFGQLKERLKFHEERAYQAEVQAAGAKLDSMLPPLFQKFPMAIEDQVYARAESILASGQKLTEKTWERLVRESHDVAQKKADQFYGSKLKSQLDKGQRGRDVGPGGATPGSTPNKPRTFDEAREAMLRHVQNGGR
jgi:hypothetical protein